MNKNIVVALVAITSFFVWRWYSNPQKPKDESSNSSILIVGTNAEYPPFTFVKDGEIVGFDIDLIKEVAKRLGKTIEWRDMPFNTLLPQLQLGTIHAIAAGMSPTPERAQQVSFTRPYLTNGNFVVIAKKGKKIPEKVEDLRDKDVIVNEGFVADLYLNEHEVHARKLPTVADAFLALDRDRAEFFVTAQTTVRPFFDQHGSDKFEIHALPGSHESIAFAVNRSDQELVHQMNRALDQIAEDGSLVTLKKRWNVGD